MLPASNFPDPFVAIDFETANDDRASACAVALVTVVGAEVVDRASFLIRPPTQDFRYTYLHGIAWEHVAGQPTFGELWRHLLERLEPAAFIAAHNADFDRGVLLACCQASGLVAPPLNFLCTVELSRAAWRQHPNKLPDVCRRLGIPLKHHHAASDAEACARIVIAARQQGFSLAPLLGRTGVAVTRPAPGAAGQERPSRDAVVEQLDRLGWLRLQKDNLELEKQARIEQDLPLEVRNRLAAIDAEFAQKEQSLTEDIAALEAEVRAMALDFGETVRGQYLAAQWVRSRITWESRGLESYSQQHPEILQFRREGEPSIRLQPVRQPPEESE
ncbi:MAG: 3'-5' exonuclease [SAR202 cluster bacterium]|nr:3'-5' exonuclease [SAR202 cluster bacterium]